MEGEMPRNWFTYSLHHELTDGTLDDSFYVTGTKRRALKTARACRRTNNPPSDATSVIVMQRPENGTWHDDKVIGVFRFGSAA